MNKFIEVKATIKINDQRGDIEIGRVGQTSSYDPHSNGLYPVWFHESSHPVFLDKETFEFVEPK